MALLQRYMKVKLIPDLALNGNAGHIKQFEQGTTASQSKAAFLLLIGVPFILALNPSLHF